jgi:26S proteasome regulatory subunit N12
LRLPWYPCQVLGASQQLPGEFAAYYIDQLTSTVRDEIASCSERAYASLTLGDTQRLMMFKSAKEAAAYAEQVRGRA